MDTKKFTLDDLGTLAGCGRRTVRYYIQIGLLPRPEGGGRAAHYTGGHLSTLLRIKELTDAGVALERVREVLSGGEPPVPPRRRQPGAVEVRSHILVAPGVEIEVSPEESGLPPEQLRAFVREVMAVAAKRLPPQNPAPAAAGSRRPARRRTPS
ncbi:MAG: helix-turn-helix domain-containing protein [Opitutaceae bacterium]|jgi:DNA-binding transcriptional MerR regulator|nr:helix-turn-helix domain-containing protein [Opitutaceae bacterium]